MPSALTTAHFWAAGAAPAIPGTHTVPTNAQHAAAATRATRPPRDHT
jgi:hypothetical protein